MNKIAYLFRNAQDFLLLFVILIISYFKDEVGGKECVMAERVNTPGHEPRLYWQGIQLTVPSYFQVYSL